MLPAYGILRNIKKKSKVGDIVPYPVRNSDDFITLKCTINCYKRSFIPYGTELWNTLDPATRHLTTLSSFSNALLNKSLYNSDQKKRKCLYTYGNRYANIIHSRLRVGCSQLNSHLCHNLRVKNSPECFCGANNETVYHFFFVCNRYNHFRLELFNTVSQVCPVTLKTLLYGDCSMSLDQNKIIFSSVHQFIIDTKRFDS